MTGRINPLDVFNSSSLALHVKWYVSYEIDANRLTFHLPFHYVWITFSWRPLRCWPSMMDYPFLYVPVTGFMSENAGAYGPMTTPHAPLFAPTATYITQRRGQNKKKKQLFLLPSHSTTDVPRRGTDDRKYSQSEQATERVSAAACGRRNSSERLRIFGYFARRTWRNLLRSRQPTHNKEKRFRSLSVAVGILLFFLKGYDSSGLEHIYITGWNTG